jgi:Na+/melibiose symporter-like transporter
VGGAIAAQYGSSTGQKQQYFGKIDPFVLFAVVPLVLIAVLFIWSDIAILGVVLIILALLVVGVDSWANRPVRKARDDDY